MVVQKGIVIKMKIKALLLTIIYIILNFSSLSFAQSAAVRVEGENYSDISFSGAYQRKLDNFSGRSSLFCYVTAEDKEYSVTYNVSVPSGGAYNMRGITSRFDKYYTTDFHIFVNGKRSVSGVSSIEEYNWQIGSRGDYMSLNDFGNVKLNAGNNEIKLVFRKDDAHITDDKYIVIIDYFDFTPTEVDTEIIDISPKTDTANVFYKGENVGFDVEFSKAASAEYSYSVKNVWDNKVKQGTFRADGDSAEIILGTMPTGWYKMEIIGANVSDSVANPLFFSVVERAERPQDTPFGADKQNKGLLIDDKINKAMGAAGIRMIRGGTDPYLGYNFANYRETHEDFGRNSEQAAGMSALLVYEHFGTQGMRETPEDLFEAYNMNKAMAEHYRSSGNAYEIWNEEEAGFYRQPADTFASYFKAAAIGISDGDSDAVKMPGGFGSTPENFFVRTLLRNDVISYSDAYAYHNHQVTINGEQNRDFIESVARKHVDAACAYDPELQIWTTEAGISMTVDENETPSLDTLISQARYYIVATAEQLAYGSDKSFWFRLNHYMESGNEWGTFSKANQPYPAVNAIATMTARLGIGEYKGTLKTDSGSYGYMFNNGTNDVAVVWADSDTRGQFYTEKPVSVTDIMGGVREYQPCNCASGLINIPITRNPIFIEFDGRSDMRNYYEANKKEHRKAAKTYSETDRLVIQQIWQGQDEYAAKTRGYVLENNKQQKITVNIYNFNNKEKNGKIYLETGDILGLDKTEFDFSIEPMSKQNFSVSAELLDNADMGEVGFLKIYAESDGEDTSGSIAAFYADDREREVSGYNFFESYNDVSKWSLGNCAEGVTLSASSGEDTLAINVDSENAHAYYWPTYKLNESAENKSGIAFYIRSTSGKEQDVNVYAYCSDGAYWLGDVNAVAYGSEWKQVIIPWHRLISFTTAKYDGDFDPQKIISIGIGSYAPKGNTSYEIKNLGFYSSDSRADKSDRKTVRISGVKDGATYKKGSHLWAKADVGDGLGVRVFLGAEELTDFTVDGSTLTVEFDAQKRGEYTLRIVKDDEWNYKNTSSVKFYVK